MERGGVNVINSEPQSNQIVRRDKSGNLFDSIKKVNIVEADGKPNETKEKGANYQALFVIGITFMGAGIALVASIGPAMLGYAALGTIFMAIGLANRDKWEKSN